MLPNERSENMLEQMQDKKTQMLLSIAELKRAVMNTQSKIEDFYNPMRWENLGISHEEYEALFREGKMYEIEETDIVNLLTNLEVALDELLK